MNLSEKKLNIYYSFLQIAYWVTSAVVFCFTTVFLQFRGYSNYEIGIVFAVGNIIGFVSQPLIAGYIDRSDRRTLLRCIRITAVLAVLLMLAVYFLPSGSISLIGVYALLVAGNTLLNPLCISLSFYIESWGCGINFSRARALGSLSFAVCNVILGMLVQRVSENAVPTAFILFSSLLGLATLLFVPVEYISSARLLIFRHISADLSDLCLDAASLGSFAARAGDGAEAFRHRCDMPRCIFAGAINSKARFARTGLIF